MARLTQLCVALAAVMTLAMIVALAPNTPDQVRIYLAVLSLVACGVGFLVLIRDLISKGR